MQPRNKIVKATKDDYPFYLKMQNLMLDQTAFWVKECVENNQSFDTHTELKFQINS